MLQALERSLVSNGVTNRLLFNRVTGAVAEYVAAARKHGQYASYRDRYDVDPSFEFVGPGTTLYGRGDVVLGADSYVGHHSRIQAKEGLTACIGDNTAVSYHVHLFTQNRVADQDMSGVRNRDRHLDVERGDVAVGDDCWIGAMTFVTEGCEIGDNTVVGANAVVTDDLPPYCVAAGVPARVSTFKSCLDDERVAELAVEYRDVLDDDLAGALASEGVL